MQINQVLVKELQMLNFAGKWKLIECLSMALLYEKGDIFLPYLVNLGLQLTYGGCFPPENVVHKPQTMEINWLTSRHSCIQGGFATTPFTCKAFGSKDKVLGQDVAWNSWIIPKDKGIPFFTAVIFTLFSFTLFSPRELYNETRDYIKILDVFRVLNWQGCLNHLYVAI